MAEEFDIQELNLEDVMGDRFGRYSKYIIQDRALPDIRDGLKPVQRRILYAMYAEGNTSDKQFRKCAKTVGNVIGNYHPHGDSSVYEAMVRLSQDWKLRDVLVEMHGNNGSMDGDPAAAMRYTEARLSKISEELLRDIDKETVEFVWNFDDTDQEPVVLPARFPNLLVNGSTGISAGYATEIPPHNLGEVIDATIYTIDHPEASVKDLMQFVKGPDFPTGAIIQGVKELEKAYKTGKGKVVVRSKTKIEPIKGNKEKIVISEIPYEVNKASLVKKMDEIRVNKKIDGIAEVRDESDRTGLQIVVELKKEANAEGILNYLLKNTDLQINYNFNMVAIDDRRPVQVGLKTIIASYISYQKEVITKRTQYNLNKAQARIHIVDGLMKALSILDEVIALIRNSNDKKDARKRLCEEFDFSEIQAEAIVTLQLYRLTNTDITTLQNEHLELNEQVARYQSILNSEKVLKNVMKTELREVKKKFMTPRLTMIQDQIEEIKIETAVLVAEEDVMVSVTKQGYYKRTSLRSYAASTTDELAMREGDDIVLVTKASTLSSLVLFTSKGNYLHFPVHELPDIKWKEIGQHLSQTISLQQQEVIIAAYIVEKDDQSLEHERMVFITKEGMIKQTERTAFGTYRGYKTRTSRAIKLKTDTDEVLSVYVAGKEQYEVLLISHCGFSLRYRLDEVPIVGTAASGVKAMNLRKDDYLVMGAIFAEEEKEPQLLIVTQRGNVKRFSVKELSTLSRAKRGLMVLRELKAKPHRIVYADLIQSLNDRYHLMTEKSEEVTIIAKEITLADRTSNGSAIVSEEQGEVVDIVKNQLINLN
ncbi:DNA topoisomerase IV subunit A [Granulicatella balaenopterae]|uniref:DNA topoisomerase 4 subunit A n=1 Tax=Granulicatella balaenopterae TaxID=137733 RepID=A0A1H9MN48_9LACT|nr:DNA topoisomerase IV subunit A [Granulicatella balaenopterae]SER25126.1 DNA topoisomerase IV subunit A [Granulicatella balaenopterae]